MGSLTLNATQLAQIQGMYNQIGSGVTVADVWSQLASYGDSYATSAAQVIGAPGTLPWTIVRSIWSTTNADFSKFDAVAQQHLSNYINDIVGSTPTSAGDYLLPTSRDIETSYATALAKYGIQPYTAIDVVLEKIIASYKVSPPHWYNYRNSGVKSRFVASISHVLGIVLVVIASKFESIFAQ
jgi:hypothetical protein